MSNLDAIQTGNDRSQPDMVRQFDRPLVDLSDPQSAREAFQSVQGHDRQGIFGNGHLMFESPYGHDGQNKWSHHFEHHGYPSISTSANDATAATAAGSDAGSSPAASSPGGIDQQIYATLQLIEQDLQQLLSDWGMADSPAPTSSDKPTTTTSYKPTPTTSDKPTTATSDKPTTATSDKPTTATSDKPTPTSSDKATTTTSGGTTTSASERASADTTATTNTGVANATTSPTSTDTTQLSTGSSDALVTPTSSDPFIANLQLSDPILAKTITDASKVMSAAGFSQMESDLDTAYTGGQNSYNGSTNYESGNPNYNVNLMSKALKDDGLSAADQSALTSVLQSDMPAALASDKFVASIQQSDPTLAKALTDASGQMSQSGYSSLEGHVQQFYTGDPDGTTSLPNQTYLDSVLMNNALAGTNLSTADQSALTDVLKTDLPSALASDTLLATLQQTDPTLAKTLSDASGAMSSTGYTELESYVAQNSTWNQSNDASLMNEALSQAGLSSSDANALSSVLQSDMPSALTATPSAAVLQEMDQAKEAYMNDYSLDMVGVSPIGGNGGGGKSGTGWTDSDQAPANADKVGPWNAIAPLDPNNYDKNAQVQIANEAVYFHLKTGGWVEAESPSQDEFWEAQYGVNNSRSGSAGDGHLNSDGSYSFTAPPADMNEQAGTKTLPFNPDLYDGVYYTMEAKTNVPNSGLALDAGADYFLSSYPTGETTRPQAGQSNWVTLTDNYQNLYLSTLSSAELQADPPPGLS